MKYDRQITISIGNSRKDLMWRQVKQSVSELYARLSTPVRGAETLHEYFQMKKSQQDELKDIGGFVGGTLNGPRRKAINVVCRDVVTLDFDNIPGWQTDLIIKKTEELACGYCIYSTRKHTPSAPRLRVVIALDRTVTPDEYEPIARRIAEYIGISMADPTTFETSRLMYWPSCCADSEFVYKTKDAPLASADKLLATYADWHDFRSWPQVPGAISYQKLAMKQGDPTEKNGVVGAFCRTYDVLAAMDAFLPKIYDPVDGDPDRFTYLGGSTTGGAIIYDNGKFLYSHHATDPCSGRLVNAFDLVRLHKFGEKDEGAAPDTPVSKLPSYKAMCDLAYSLQEVRFKKAAEDFSGSTSEGISLEWTKQLKFNSTGGYERTINNTLLLLQNAPELKGCAYYDSFSDKEWTATNLPWKNERGYWTDEDTTELRAHLEFTYNYRISKQDLSDAVSSVARRQAFHPVRDYLNSLEWDGVARLDTLFIDYLGAEDSPYSRAVSRKSLVGAVSRIMDPGCKFDYMPVLVGDQGRNKSMFIGKLAGANWFSDSIQSFEGKNAFEAVCGKWIIEIPEMHAFDKTTMNQAKAFITKQSDYFRAAYARKATEHPRQCVFFGTTNNVECLRDETGGRRYWIIDIDTCPRKKSVIEDLDLERDQIWAEAVKCWRKGEKLYLSENLEKEAAKKQEAHRERSPWTDTVADFLSKPIPDDWYYWPINKRRDYWCGFALGDIHTVSRKTVCVREIWQECIGKDIASLDNRKSREITGILRSLGWRPGGQGRPGEGYGSQKVFKAPLLNA